MDRTIHQIVTVLSQFDEAASADAAALLGTDAKQRLNQLRRSLNF